MEPAATKETPAADYVLPTLGRIVLYTLHDGTTCPAIVVKTTADIVDLRLFLDGRQEKETFQVGTPYKPNVPYSPTPQPGTWRWPERV